MVWPESSGRNTVVDAAVRSVTEWPGGLGSLGVRRYRVELLREAAGNLPAVLDSHVRILANGHHVAGSPVGSAGTHGATWRRAR